MNKHNVRTTAKKQRRIAAAKARRTRRKSKLAAMIQAKLPGLYQIIDSLTKRVEELKAKVPQEEVK